jgi:hypothetical protein
MILLGQRLSHPCRSVTGVHDEFLLHAPCPGPCLFWYSMGLQQWYSVCAGAGGSECGLAHRGEREVCGNKRCGISQLGGPLCHQSSSRQLPGGGGFEYLRQEISTECLSLCMGTRTRTLCWPTSKELSEAFHSFYCDLNCSSEMSTVSTIISIVQVLSVAGQSVIGALAAAGTRSTVCTSATAERPAPSRLRPRMVLPRIGAGRSSKVLVA